MHVTVMLATPNPCHLTQEVFRATGSDKCGKLRRHNDQQVNEAFGSPFSGPGAVGTVHE